MNACQTTVVLSLATVLFAVPCTPAVAQFGAGGGFGGIEIDADGVITAIPVSRRAATLNKKRREAQAKADLPGDLTETSKMRMVSLVRLEAACRDLIEANKPIPNAFKYLAGLQRIDHVFIFPETDDLVIAGPAEGFAPDASGRIVGATTGRPPLMLDDLVVALRASAEGESIGCSIDPDQQRLVKMQDWLRRNSSPASADVAKRRYHQMAKILGMHHVTTWGVPQDSHF